jgi:hypothetical protein
MLSNVDHFEDPDNNMREVSEDLIIILYLLEFSNKQIIISTHTLSTRVQ